MSARACLGCRRTFTPERRGESRCPDCRARHAASIANARERGEPWRFIYDLPEWVDVRTRVLARDDWRCRAIVTGGTRCTATEGLQAHHLESLADLYRRSTSREGFVASALAERNLAALCPAHHARADATRREADKRRWIETRR